MESPLGSDLARLVRVWRALIQTCANDRRAKRIKLTEKAEPLINEMEEVIGKTRDEILAGVSKEEVETLLNLIRKLEHNILDLQAKD